jgi:hypothetical protein
VIVAVVVIVMMVMAVIVAMAMVVGMVVGVFVALVAMEMVMAVVPFRRRLDDREHGLFIGPTATFAHEALLLDGIDSPTIITTGVSRKPGQEITFRLA